jgi:hypothetical protein
VDGVPFFESDMTSYVRVVIRDVGGPHNSNNNVTTSLDCYFSCQPRAHTNFRGVVQSICKFDVGSSPSNSKCKRGGKGTTSQHDRVSNRKLTQN